MADATRYDDLVARYKTTEDDVVIVNSDWSVIRLSASLLAQKEPSEIRRMLRHIYRGKYAAVSHS